MLCECGWVRRIRPVGERPIPIKGLRFQLDVLTRVVKAVARAG